ncbi:MAG: amidohydrolase family protein [Myxococcota bacterium]
MEFSTFGSKPRAQLSIAHAQDLESPASSIQRVTRSRGESRDARREPPVPDTSKLALVGGTLWFPSGEVLTNGLVVIQEAQISYAGPLRPIPSDAVVVKVEGKVLTPGFFALETGIGLAEISAEPSTRDDSPGNDEVDPIRAAFSAADGFNPRSTLIPVARTGGITVALSTPTGGLISGTSALTDLGADSARILRAGAALHVQLDAPGLSALEGTFPLALMRLREALDDTRSHVSRPQAYEQNALRALRTSRLDLLCLAEVLGKRRPIVARVSRAADILRIIELLKAYGIRLILSGAEEGWMVADQIAAAEVPVILKPLTNQPTSFRELASSYENAARLHESGVRLMFTTYDAHSVHNLRQEAGNAIRAGLPREVALQALTSTPAEVFGLEYGLTLQRGSRGDVAVWSADPFEVTSHLEQLYSGGQRVDLTTRQSMLRERYRRRSP